VVYGYTQIQPNDMSEVFVLYKYFRHIYVITEDYPDQTIQSEQEKLNNLYDNFTRKYDLIFVIYTEVLEYLNIK